MDKGELIDVDAINQINQVTEGMIQSPQCDIVDIFPEQIPKSTTWYGDVEQYFLKTEFQDYLRKCFRIILKFICYYPYTVIQSEFPQQVPGTDQYRNTEKTYQRISIDEMESLLFDTIGKNGCFSIYFREISLLIVIESESFSTVVYGLDQSSEISNLLSDLVHNEGLFLRHCFRQF
ncbi:hypothetical protein A7X67_02500 [Clostridium sp. W14A]|nr:hypothetical protein A7X67_02500 [Clostridium sp. W14A]